MINAALRSAPPLALARSFVEDCLHRADPVDARFNSAWTRSLGALVRHERTGALAGVTGHVAESVVEVLLVDIGYHPVWHIAGPGRHGVDLLMASPAVDHVLAIEVKGSLRAGSLPRLSRRAVMQMSAAWVDKSDNPGMAECELESADVYGAVIAVSFAEMVVRAIVSDDFQRWRGVATLEDLTSVAVDGPPSSPTTTTGPRATMDL